MTHPTNDHRHPTTSHTTTDDFADKILGRIDKEHVTPRPRWQFLIKDVLFWMLWVISTVLGAIAASAIAFAWVNAGWEFREITHQGLMPFLLEMMPLVWLVALGAVLFAAHENLRHTAVGYRYPFVMVLGLSLLITVLLGIALFIAGIGARVEEEFGQRIPLQRPVLIRQQMRWTDPQRGLLAGEVVSVDGPSSVFVLRTMDGRQWQVMSSGISDPSRDVLKQYSMVRVIGVPPVVAVPAEHVSTTAFRACAIFPWNVHGTPQQWDAFHTGRTTFFKRVDAPRNIVVMAGTENTDDPCTQLQFTKPLRMIQQRLGQ